MSLHAGLVGAGGFVVGMFGLGRLVARWLGPAEDVPPGKRWLFTKISTLAIVAVMVGVPVLFRVVPVGHRLLPSAPPLAAAQLNSALAVGVAVLGYTAAWVGLGPFRTTRQWLDGEIRRRLRLVRLFLLGLTIFVAVVVELGYLYSLPAPELLFGVTLIAAGGTHLSRTVAFPLLSTAELCGIRQPTAGERDRIERIYHRLEIPLPDSIEVTVNDAAEQIAVLAKNDHRVLALSDSVFASLDEDTLSVGLAHAEGRTTHRVDSLQRAHRWFLLSSIVFDVWSVFFGLWGYFVASRASVLLLYYLAGVVLLNGPLLFLARQLTIRGRERIHLADEYTMEHVERSVVADVYEDPERRWGVICWEQNQNDGAAILFEPPIRDRLERVGLTDASDAKQSGRPAAHSESTE